MTPREIESIMARQSSLIDRIIDGWPARAACWVVIVLSIAVFLLVSIGILAR